MKHMSDDGIWLILPGYDHTLIKMYGLVMVSSEAKVDSLSAMDELHRLQDELSYMEVSVSVLRILRRSSMSQG